GQKADPRAQMLRVSGNLQQRLRDSLKQDAVHDSRILERQGAEGFRQREDHVEVLNRQQFRRTLFHPPRPGRGLALGTVAIAARVVGDLLVAALVTRLHVSAQRGSPALRHGLENSSLLGRYAMTVLG